MLHQTERRQRNYRFVASSYGPLKMRLFSRNGYELHLYYTLVRRYGRVYTVIRMLTLRKVESKWRKDFITSFFQDRSSNVRYQRSVVMKDPKTTILLSRKKKSNQKTEKGKMEKTRKSEIQRHWTQSI